jgi:thymidylate synthase
MNDIDKQYQQLLKDIIEYGVEKQDRTGTGTKSIFGYTIRHNMKDGFPLLTTKKMAWKTMVTELLWFLRGDTNIKFLVDNGCNIWNGDAYKRFSTEATLIKEGYESGDILGSQPHIDKMFSDPEKLIILSKEEFINKIKTDDEFAKEWGELGPIYGAQWRNWTNDNFYKYINSYDRKTNEPQIEHKIKQIDQITSLINDLKTNPDSRRLMVNAWNVGELAQMVLPPCHYGFQVYTRELSIEEKWEQYTKSGLNIEINGTPLELKHMGTSFYPKSLPQRAISLMWNQRSVDTFLGLPFNIASYGLLLEIIAKEVNMVPDELIGNLGDTHLYLNHIEQAKEQIGRDLTDEERYNKWFNNNYETGMERHFDPNNLPDFDNEYYVPTPKRTREPFELPKLRISSGPLDDIAHHEIMDFDILNYQSHPTIKAPLSN